MTFEHFAGLLIAAICAFEIYRAVTRQETRMPPHGVRVSKAEQPVLYWVSLCAWSGFMIASILIVWERL